MLDRGIVTQVRALLLAGLTQRAIARRLAGQISRGSIHRIATGKRQDIEPPPDDPPPGPAARCPTCGAKVVGPCIACQARAEPRRLLPEDLRELAGGLDAPLGLDLKPEHAKRYEQIKRAPSAAAAGRAA